MYKKITWAALLTAIAIIIPMFMPLKVLIPPASYTFASHVPIFIACFISPAVAIAVCLGASLGFFLAGFPYVIVARALTHVIFAGLLALYIKQTQKIKLWNMILLSIIVGLVHGIGEALVVQWLFFPNMSNATFYIWILVGFGTLVHSMIDFWLAWIIVKASRLIK